LLNAADPSEFDPSTLFPALVSTNETVPVGPVTVLPTPPTVPESVYEPTDPVDEIAVVDAYVPCTVYETVFDVLVE
jgi:hypothetical protein